MTPLHLNFLSPFQGAPQIAPVIVFRLPRWLWCIVPQISHLNVFIPIHCGKLAWIRKELPESDVLTWRLGQESSSNRDTCDREWQPNNVIILNTPNQDNLLPIVVEAFRIEFSTLLVSSPLVILNQSSRELPASIRLIHVSFSIILISFLTNGISAILNPFNGRCSTETHGDCQ